MSGLEIDGAQSCIILRFRNPMPSLMVDGVAGERAEGRGQRPWEG